MARRHTGRLLARVTRGQGRDPVFNASVRVRMDGYPDFTALTDTDGRAEFTLPAPAPDYISALRGGKNPFYICDITAVTPFSPGYEIKGCRIYADVCSQAEMHCGDKGGERKTVVVTGPKRGSSVPGSAAYSELACRAAGEFSPNMRLTVSTAPPGEPGEVSRDDFPGYIKNIAAGELMPILPPAALRVCAAALITRTKLRLAKGGLRAAGFGYDLASEPDWSYAYLPGRVTFDTVSYAVDSLIGFSLCGGREGIRPDPFAPEIARSAEMAARGMSFEDIISTLYGGTKLCADKKERRPNCGCLPLKRGCEGEEVKALQRMLNTAAGNIAGLSVILCADGFFDTATENAVRSFQALSGLPKTGEADTQTLFGIKRLYDYITNPRDKKPRPGTNALALRHCINILSRREGVKRIPPVSLAGEYGEDTRKSEECYARLKGIPLTADRTALREAIINEAQSRARGEKKLPKPGLARGAAGEEVIVLQNLINAVSGTIMGGAPLKADGVFGELTRRALMTVQRLTGLEPTGIACKKTLSVLSRELIAPDTSACG